MSIYHRYALFYNLQRYLADVDRLSHIAAQCNVVEDIADRETLIISHLSTFTYIYEDPLLDAEPALLRDDGRQENFEEQESREGRKTHGAYDDKENGNGHEVYEDEEDHKDQDNHKDSVDHGDHEMPDVQLDGQDKDAYESTITGDETQLDFDRTVDDLDQPPDTDVDAANSETAPPTVSDYSGVSITRTQLSRVIACERILYRLNAGLIKNIHRVEAEEDELSSQTIKHFWREASRLNGTDKIKSVRVMERELATSSWWEDESNRENKDGSDTAWETASNASNPVAGAASQRPSSPLYNSIGPDDLLWEDQVQQWQLDLGRTVDDQGRRYVKM